MTTRSSPSPTPIRIDPSFWKSELRAPANIHSRNSASAVSPQTVRQLRMPPTDRGKDPEHRLSTRRSDSGASDAVPLSP
jgi:hypothetical protein